MRKSVNLGDNFVEAINFLNDDLVEIFSELRIIETLGQKLRESLNRDEWIANFVRHARGQVRPKGGAIDQVLLLPQIFLRGQIMNDGDSTEGGVLVEESPRFDREGAACVRIDPLSWRKVRLCLKSFPQHSSQPSANGFNRPVERIGSFQPEDRFRGGIKPANDAFFINGDNSGRNRFQERFGQGFLQSDLFVEKRVLENGGNMLGQDHQAFEITVIKGQTGDAMTEKQPADNLATCIKRDDNFGAKAIERPTQERPLILRGDVCEVGARNEVPM